jgi:hypothetical protein
MKPTRRKLCSRPVHTKASGSTTDTAMVDETLCKALCHNLIVLIHGTYELGIDPVFRQEAA